MGGVNIIGFRVEDALPVVYKALDEAILAGSIDAAVHSMKDIPARRPAGLSTCAILERDSPADFLVHTVPEKEIRVIGTSSTRRMAQLKRYKKGSEIHPVRGNVDTRLRKLSEGKFDAIVLAEAGLVAAPPQQGAGLLRFLPRRQACPE